MRGSQRSWRQTVRILSAALVVMLAACATAQTPPVARPVPAIQHVVVISIDGLRPDVLLRADTPAIRDLMKHGSFTMWANTTDVGITLPSHTSMMTGVWVKKHGVTWNDDSKIGNYPQVPTLFAYAHDAGYTTALVAGKKKFDALAKPGTVDVVEIPVNKSKVADDAVRDEAVKVIGEKHPDVLMVHFPQTDSVGHSQGWGSHEQVATVENADKGVAAVVEALKRAGVYDSTLIILSADHGGQGKGHGGLDPRTHHIPWIAEGPGVKQNYDLTLDAKLQVNTVDTFATAMYVLGLALPADADGKPVMDIFEAAPAKVEAAAPAKE